MHRLWHVTKELKEKERSIGEEDAARSGKSFEPKAYYPKKTSSLLYKSKVYICRFVSLTVRAAVSGV